MATIERGAKYVSGYLFETPISASIVEMTPTQLITCYQLAEAVQMSLTTC
jgi:hypothetical protein